MTHALFLLQQPLNQFLVGDRLWICYLNKCPRTTIIKGWTSGDERIKKPLICFGLGPVEIKWEGLIEKTHSQLLLTHTIRRDQTQGDAKVSFPLLHAIDHYPTWILPFPDHRFEQTTCPVCCVCLVLNHRLIFLITEHVMIMKVNQETFDNWVGNSAEIQKGSFLGLKQFNSNTWVLLWIVSCSGALMWSMFVQRSVSRPKYKDQHERLRWS